MLLKNYRSFVIYSPKSPGLLVLVNFSRGIKHLPSYLLPIMHFYFSFVKVTLER